MKQLEEKNNFPDWITESLQVLKPPENLTVSEWADKYRILLKKTSSEPGPWKTSRVPYMKKVMDSFNDPEVEEIVLPKSCQVAGTEAINNIICFIVAQDQKSTLVVYPTEPLAKFTSENRIEPMIEVQPETNKHYRKNESKVLELQFDSMYLVLAGANSPATLSSRPCGNILLDEVDKYPKQAGKEASPIELAKDRSITFYDRKIVITSTPTYEHGAIWQAWVSCDRQFKYLVPCPFCGHNQILIFSQLKWSKTAITNDDIFDSAYYECESCKGIIRDYHKNEMLQAGDWIAIKDEGKKKTGFHINALYSPWVKFGKMAVLWKSAQGDDLLLMNFINSYLAEPWIDKETELRDSLIKDRESEFDEFVIPDDAILLTGGVDVQDNNVKYYVIRAWGVQTTSWKITNGVVNSWEAIEFIMNLEYKKQNGQPMRVHICLIDSGDGNTIDDVYDFCAMNHQWAKPAKGSSRPLPARYNISKIDRVQSKADGMSLYIYDGGKYKDSISSRMLKENGPGSWMINKNTEQDYCLQVCAEEKIKERKGNSFNFVWKKKTGRAANHYLDCEVLAFVGADLNMVRYFGMMATPENKPKQVKHDQEKKQNKFLNTGKDWLNKNKGWLK